MPRYPTIISRAPFTRFFLQSEFDFSSIAGLARDINPLATRVNGGSPNNGDPISALVDSKDTGITYVQETSSKRPLWLQSDADFDSNPAMSFDGFDDFLIKATSFGSDRGAIIAVVKLLSDTDLMVLFGSADVSAGNRYFQYCTPHNVYQYQYIEVNDSTTAPRIRGNTQLSQSVYVVSLMSDGADWDFWLTKVDEGETVISGGSTGDWLSDFPGADNHTIGILKRNTEVGAFTGKIARMLIYDGVTLSTTQMELIHASLMNKYGVS